MLYKRGRYYWMRFKWKGSLYRRSTRAEDLATATKILKRRRAKLALDEEKRVKLGPLAWGLAALESDLQQVSSWRRKDYGGELRVRQEKALRRIERMKDRNWLRKHGIQP